MKEFIDKLIERLEEKAKHDEKKAIKTDETERISLITALQAMSDRYRDAIEIVIELAEEYKGGWIPCSERLPEENVLDNGYVEPSDAVLVFTKYNSYKVSRYWGNRRNKRDYYDWVDINYRENEVIAWQPIAPYTEGE